MELHDLRAEKGQTVGLSLHEKRMEKGEIVSK